MLKAEKKVISNLTKCYSIAPLTYNGSQHFLVAAEKTDRCILFDLDGKEEATVWNEPGGVMSMVQVPGTNGQFLATHKFYSPNDSKEAKIVIATPDESGTWGIRTLVCLPHVHRFDIIENQGINYLIACALKSGHAYKDDWSMPGKVYVAELPRDLSPYNEENQLPMTVLKDGMLKNHGYYKIAMGNTQTCVISCEQGVFQFYPPAQPGADWQINQLLDTPASDAVLVDLDSDGDKELVVLSPFHGDTIRIYKKQGDHFSIVYEYPVKSAFTHAIWGGMLECGPAAIIGHRQGERNLIAFTYDSEDGCYHADILDKDCGPANVMHFSYNNEDILISTNREIDEVARYTILKI